MVARAPRAQDEWWRGEEPWRRLLSHPMLRYVTPEPPRAIIQEPFRRYEENPPGTDLGDPMRDDWTPPSVRQAEMATDIWMNNRPRRPIKRPPGDLSPPMSWGYGEDRPAGREVGPQVWDWLKRQGTEWVGKPPGPDAIPVQNLVRERLGPTGTALPEKFWPTFSGERSFLNYVTNPSGAANALAQGVRGVGELEHKFADWFSTPEGEWQQRQAAAEPPPPAPVVPQLPVLPPAVSTGAVGGSAPPAGGGGTMSPLALAIAQRMQAAGYSPAAIAGALGNAQAESGFNTGAVGDAGTSFGGFQWRDPTPGQGRRTSLEQFAAERGLPANDPNVQAEFFLHELGSPTYSRAQGGLQAAQTPEDAAAAMLHYLRPQGYNPEQFSPALVHGWDTRLRGSRDFYNQLAGGPPLPPIAEGFMQAAPPPVPNPVDQPLPVAPDFSQQNQWLDQARPTPTPAGVDPLMAVFEGLARGAAGDWRGPGSTGAMLASMGAGGMGAINAHTEAEALRQAQDAQALQEYAGRRAGVAGVQAGAQADWANLAGQTGYENQLADQGAQYANTSAAYQTGQTNARTTFDTRQANRENQHQFMTDQWQRSQPQVLTAGQEGIAFQTPGQGVTWDMAPAQREIDYTQEPYASSQKYADLAQARDIPMLTNEIVKDLVANGQAPAVFQDLYAQASEAAAATIPPEIISKPELYKQALDSAIAAQLMAMTAGNYDWLPNAALYNPGARMLIGQ